MIRITAILHLLTATLATAANPFFAMDTIARGTPETIVPTLKQLGYDGLGGAPGDHKMATALRDAGLRHFNGYLTLTLSHAGPALDPALKQKIDVMQGTQSAIWLAINKVETETGPAPKSSPDGDLVAIQKIRELADYAHTRGLTVALYPHTAFWLESFDDATRLTAKLDHPAVGHTFNLCHWLKVEGSQRDPVPVIQAALPRLHFVTINGADTGDTKNMGWDRLIRPLGQGTYDIRDFLKRLQQTGYQGPIGFQGYGIKGDATTVLRDTIEAWKTLRPNP
jgi:sugar phosphate isomerase/epimerase